MKTKQAVRTLMRQYQEELTARNADWIVAEANAPGHTDAEISKPLISVLAVEDWQTPLISFVRDAVGDLKAVGVLDGLVSLESDACDQPDSFCGEE